MEKKSFIQKITDSIKPLTSPLKLSPHYIDLQPVKETIKIYCKNNRTYHEVPIGSDLSEIHRIISKKLKRRILCARVNNQVKGLTFRCWEPKDIEFLDYTDLSGSRTYLRTLCFILFKVVHDMFPDKQLNLEHPISKGYYCTFTDSTQLKKDVIEKIKNNMRYIIYKDIPFILKTLRTDDAVELFRERNMNDKALLLRTAGMSYASYYELDGYVDYFYGCLTPSAGYIRCFDLIPYASGMLLCVPQIENPNKLYPVVPQNKMFEAYKRYLELQKVIKINNVGDLNVEIQKGNAGKVVTVCEAMQEKHIAKIAEHIAERYNSCGTNIVLISGPSSSGKTTFCKRLQIQLITNLLTPVGISLDDYYLNRADTPLDENGEYDFESLYAIDLPYFKSDLKKLLAGMEVELPVFNFETGERECTGKKIRLRSNSVLVMEGIHALNPELTDSIPSENLFKIYVSALTTISLDGHNYIPTTDNRLLRRIVRDYQFRGYSAKQTISMWKSVRRGEDKWIFPYQENADDTFNSAMIYELASLRRLAEPILNEVLETDEEYAEAYRLLRFLRFFNHIPENEIPTTSLLCEFLGGGKKLDYYDDDDI
ncbi:MAG: nucleoside kinase [Tannerella sp.]|jgi:uridine kinase|nr:nucleoside kinase [Tannerella sp.]